ncbi:hypothetical protein B0H19DRAFT_1370834 [Mycena capillaripes]|nr:hypothetical protein B0H19DRAFT_1370834 [Mycena capillaripes]
MGRSRCQRLEPFFSGRNSLGPEPAFGALSNLPNPYNDAFGKLYSLTRTLRRKKNRRARSVTQAKMGHSKDFERRRRGYRSCADDWNLKWKYSLDTPTRKLVEALVHEEKKRHNSPHVKCSCKTRHTEFYDMGVEELLRCAESWMYLLGQKAVRQRIV